MRFESISANIDMMASPKYNAMMVPCGTAKTPCDSCTGAVRYPYDVVHDLSHRTAAVLLEGPKMLSQNRTVPILSMWHSCGARLFVARKSPDAPCDVLKELRRPYGAPGIVRAPYDFAKIGIVRAP